MFSGIYHHLTLKPTKFHGCIIITKIFKAFWLLLAAILDFNRHIELFHVVACRLPETSTLLTYLILDRKGLVSGSDFPYLSVCRRSVGPCSGLVLRLVADYVVKVSPCFTSTFCSVLAPWQSAQPSCVWWC